MGKKINITKVPQQANPFKPNGNITLSADEKARDVAEAKVVKHNGKPLLKDEEATTLARFKVQGTLSQTEAQEYHRLLNIVGE